MKELNNVLHELGITKVQLSKVLGVSRQMIYNYLVMNDINKWPSDKKVLLFNLLGIKELEELSNLKITTDYIFEVEAKIKSLDSGAGVEHNYEDTSFYNNLEKKQKELLYNIMQLLKENLEDDSEDGINYTTYKYLYYFIQSLNSSKELKYILAYFAKITNSVKASEFAFDENDQFIFESVLFSAMTLFGNKKTLSKAKVEELHERFVAQVEQKHEEKLSRTMELNTIRMQALRELGYSEINTSNAAEVFEKIAEIESRKVAV
jgi:hypothetical protein